MAGGPSIYLSNMLLNKALKGTDFTPPATLYVALFTSNSETELRANAGWAGLEVSGNGYARQAVTAANWSASTAGEGTYGIEVAFPAATGTWGTLYQAALMTALTGGNVYFFGPLSASVLIQNGDVLKLTANNFKVRL